MKKSLLKTLLSASFFLLAVSTGAKATVVFDMVDVGNAGNAPDIVNGKSYGSVPYEYKIGTYEVTNAQYVEFLNTVAKSDPYGLYNANMATDERHGGIIRSGSDGSYVYTAKDGFADRPVVYVTLANAMYFTNWLTNGQGDGGILSGSYNMSLSLPDAATRLEPQAAGQIQYFVSSENEWHKAAFYDPTLNDGAGGYWGYATMSDTQPTKGGPSALPNRANYGGNNSNNNTRNVGSYSGSYSYYGTFDQEGNAAEFTDTIANASSRVRRGASFSNTLLGREYRGGDAFDVAASSIGFRIVAVTAIPEPSGAALISVTGVGLLLAGAKSLRGKR